MTAESGVVCHTTALKCPSTRLSAGVPMLAKPTTKLKPEMTKALVLAILMVCSSLSVYLTSQVEQNSLEDAMKVSRSYSQPSNVSQFGFDIPQNLDLSFSDYEMVHDVVIDENGEIYMVLLPDEETFYTGGSSIYEDDWVCHVLKFNQTGVLQWRTEEFRNTNNDHYCTSLALHDDDVRVVHIGDAATSGSSYSWADEGLSLPFGH